MWFNRGNTISYTYSAPFIHYLSGQSQNNTNSTYDFLGMRATVRNILKTNPNAKFHLYCDDQRSRIIFDVFISAGINFEALDVTLLSDGTASYLEYNEITEADYNVLPMEWNKYMETYLSNRANINYQHQDFSFVTNTDLITQLSKMLTYLPTFSNVTYWIQYPEYLVNTQSTSLAKNRLNMNIIEKSPKAMYDGLDESTRKEYQHVVLANALVDNTNNLNTLDDAVNYFNETLNKTDKEVVLILGSQFTTLAENQSFLDQTLAMYTPTIQSGNQVLYKNKIYTTVDNQTITVDGKNLIIGEVGVHLYFKGHPNFTLSDELITFFKEKNITILPKRTPVEVLFWMYDIKVGGFASTSYLSCEKEQIEFIYYIKQQWSTALQLMGEQGFFDNTKFFVQ